MSSAVRSKVLKPVYYTVKPFPMRALTHLGKHECAETGMHSASRSQALPGNALPPGSALLWRSPSSTLSVKRSRNFALLKVARCHEPLDRSDSTDRKCFRLHALRDS